MFIYTFKIFVLILGYLLAIKSIYAYVFLTIYAKKIVINNIFKYILVILYVRTTYIYIQKIDLKYRINILKSN